MALRSSLWHLLAVAFIQYSSAIDFGSLNFLPPADKPNRADVVNAEQAALGVININNKQGPDAVSTNNMNDIKERLDAAKNNISRLQSQMSSKSDVQPVTLTDLQSEVESVTSSSSNVQDALNQLKARLENMKQTTSQTGSEVSTGSEVTSDVHESTNELKEKVPNLNVDVMSVLNDLSAMNSELGDLDLQLTSLAEAEVRDDHSAVTEMEQTMYSVEEKLDTYSQTMITNCKAMDKQFLQVQGINAIKQGERGYIKFPLIAATSSSTFDGGHAINAIDGSDETFFYNTPRQCQSTNYEWASKPWLKLTLDKISVIGGLRVLPRGDCCYYLTNHVKILTNVDDPTTSGNNEMCLTTTSQLTPGEFVILPCTHSREALHIFITSDVNYEVSFCEIEALGYPGVPESTTFGRPALQSSSASVETQAHLAVDNDVSTCARTKEASVGGNVWWMVDLQDTRNISKVVLTFKNDSPGAVRSGLDVFLYEAFPSFCDESSRTFCGSTIDNGDDLVTVDCNAGHYARYIRVIKHGALATEFLELCEVTTV